MAWRRPGDKLLSETMLFSLLTHICVTRPQWDIWPLPQGPCSCVALQNNYTFRKRGQDYMYCIQMNTCRTRFDYKYIREVLSLYTLICFDTKLKMTVSFNLNDLCWTYKRHASGQFLWKISRLFILELCTGDSRRPVFCLFACFCFVLFFWITFEFHGVKFDGFRWIFLNLQLDTLS